MSTREFAEARRVMTGVTASLERRCLLWLAARLPRWSNSDHQLVIVKTAESSLWGPRRRVNCAS